LRPDIPPLALRSYQPETQHGLTSLGISMNRYSKYANSLARNRILMFYNSYLVCDQKIYEQFVLANIHHGIYSNLAYIEVIH
jgi:hypothetical protein